VRRVRVSVMGAGDGSGNLKPSIAYEVLPNLSK
jgi:hypothetical protein